MGMYLGLDSGLWGSAGRNRWSDGGGWKRIKRVPGSVWGSTLSAWLRVVGMHLARTRDDVFERPLV